MLNQYPNSPLPNVYFPFISPMKPQCVALAWLKEKEKYKEEPLLSAANHLVCKGHYDYF